MKPKKSINKKADKRRITTHFIKSANFRPVLVNGVIGGVTPHGQVYAAVYTERMAIPQSVVYELKDGGLGKAVERVGKTGVVREMDAGLLFDEATARSVAKWLLEKADELKELKSTSRGQR